MNIKAHAHYTAFAKWLHWLVAGLILAQYLLMELAERAEHAGLTVKQLGIVANHKSIGITILLFAFARVGFRLISPAPALPNSMPGWQIKASHASHVLLYVFLFALPITGWLMSSASAYTVSWFNWLTLPDLIVADKANADWLKVVHERLSDALVILAAVHIVAALKHHIIDKDSVLTRMLSKGSLAAGLLVLVMSIGLFGGFKSDNKMLGSKEPVITNEANSTISKVELKQSVLPLWQIDYANSHIKFTGEQAGAPFTGQWQQWQGALQFSADDLEQSVFNVSVDIGSVESNDDERDETILSADFFDVLKFPNAEFQAQNFSSIDNGFVASGQLTIKEINQPATLRFTVEQSGGEITLIGKATLERHKWNIGIGDWADPTWVGSNVEVDVLVTAVVQ